MIKVKSMKKSILIDKILSYFLLVLFAVFFLLPLIYMVTISLNPDELNIVKIMGTPKAFLPSQVSLKNYMDVFNRMPFGRFVLNSIIIVSSTVAGGLLINSMCAFGLARFSFRGRNLIVSLIVALIIIPFEAIAVPLLLMVNRFGWLDTYRVQIIPFLANPFYIFLFYQFFLGFPRDLEEAALIDGAGWFKIYWSITLPLSKPIIASVAILHFLQHWGFFLWPLMVTRGFEYRPLPVAMQTFFGQYPRDWGDVMAFASMMTVPVLILFVFLQNQYVNTVKTAGIK